MAKYRSQLKLSPFILYTALWLTPLSIFLLNFFQWHSIQETLISAQTLSIAFFSFYQAALSTFLAAMFAVLPAWYAHASKKWGKLIVRSTLFIPFFFPVISATTTFALLNQWLNGFHWQFLFSLKAIIIGNIFFNLPIFIYYLSEGFSTIPQTIQDLSTLDGLSKNKTIFKVILPLLLPYIAKATLLCFTYCFTNLAIILNLGGIHFSTLELSIATTLSSSFDFSSALSYGLLQWVILSVVFLLLSFIKPYELPIEKPSYFSFPKQLLPLAWIPVIFEYLILILTLIFSFFNFYTNHFSLQAFKTLFSIHFNQDFPIWISFSNSLLIATLTSFFILLLTYCMIQCRFRFSSWIIFSSLGLSSAFLATTLIYLNIQFSFPLFPLLMIGYTLITLPIAYAFLSPYFEQFPKEIIESAKVEGASRISIFRYIEWPLLCPIFIASFLQLIAIILGEFSLTYTMQVYSYFPTLALTTNFLASNRNLNCASSLSAITLIFIAFLYLLSQYFIQKINKSK